MSDPPQAPETPDPAGGEAASPDPAGPGQDDGAGAAAPAPVVTRRVKVLGAVLAVVAALALVITLAGRGGGAATSGGPGGGGDGAGDGRTAIGVPPRPDLARVGVPGPGTERLGGTVVDASGAPVADVQITAELELGPGDHSRAPAAAPAPVVAFAGADGAFVLEGLEPGRHRLRVEGDGVFTAELRLVPVPSDDLRIAVARRVDVAGIVVDGGRTVPGAVVTIDGEAIGGRLTTVADDAGAFAFEALPEGAYRVWAHDRDLAARAVRAPRLGGGPFAPVTLTLEPATIVVGRVVDRATGLGIVAAVALEPAGEGAVEAARFARSGDDGVFRIEGVPHGRWLVDAHATGWLSTGALELDAGRGIPELRLVAGAIVEGRVVDARGRPIAGAVVRAIGEGALGRGLEASADVEADRVRRFSGFAPRGTAPPPPGGHGAGAAVAAPGDFTRDPRFIPRGELGVLLGPLPYPPPRGAATARQATIVAGAIPGDPGAGPVVPGAAGVAAPLPVDPAYAPRHVTDDRGRFRLTGLDAASWTVIAHAPGMAEGRSKKLALVSGKVAADVEIVLGAGAFLTGEVRARRGGPLVGATVIATPRGGGDRDRVVAVTGADGRYRIGPLVGEVVVTAAVWGHADARAEVRLPAPDGDVAAEHVHDFELAAADATLRGRVVAPDRLPVRGAEVIVEGGPARGRRARTDDTGWFEIGQVADGEAAVEIAHADFPRQRFTIDTAADASLTVAWGGALEGLVLDRHTGLPLAGIPVTLAGPSGKRELATGAGGELRAGPLLAGSYTIEARPPGYVVARTKVEVAAGRAIGDVTARGLELRLERGALIAGVIRDRYGRRVAGAKVTIARADGVAVEARTDSEGEFRLRDVPTGDVTVTAEHDGARGAEAITLRPGDERLRYTLAIE